MCWPLLLFMSAGNTSALAECRCANPFGAIGGCPGAIMKSPSRKIMRSSSWTLFGDIAPGPGLSRRACHSVRDTGLETTALVTYGGRDLCTTQFAASFLQKLSLQMATVALECPTVCGEKIGTGFAYLRLGQVRGGRY